MVTESAAHPREGRQTRIQSELRLLSGFELRRAGVSVRLPQSAERLAAFLAVHDRAMDRAQVAGALWPDVTESHASGSLRSALWRLHGADSSVVEATTTQLCLAPFLQVDLRNGLALARRLLETTELSEAAQPPMQAVAVLDGDLLPDWYFDDWLVLPREQWRQLRLHALESLAMALVVRGEFAAAVAAALSEVRGEPLRESAHRCLARVHLAEGNVGEAIAVFQRFRSLLYGELGLEPSNAFYRLLGLRPDSRRSHAALWPEVTQS